MRLRPTLAFAILFCLGTGAISQTPQERVSTLKELGAACDGTAPDDAAFARAVALQRPVVIPKSSGACRLSGNFTFPATMHVAFEHGGRIAVDAGRTLTIPYVSAPAAQIFAGAGAVLLPRVAEINPIWFGADASGATNSSAGIQKAVDAAQQSGGNPTVRFSPGTYAMSSTVNLIRENAGITIAGPADSAMRQGSAPSQVLLKWTGGSAPMFTIGQDGATKAIPTSYVDFYNLAVENYGAATAWLNVQLGGNMRVARVNVTANPPASTPFGTAVIQLKSNVAGRGGGLNYSTFEHNQFDYAGPVIVKYDNQGAGNSYTWIHFDNNIVNANADMRVFELLNGGGKLLRMMGNTFNSQTRRAAGYVFHAVDMTRVGPFHLDNLVFRDNEYDDGHANSSSGANKMLKLRNVRNAAITNNNIVGNSLVTSYITVASSDHVYLSNNRAYSFNGPLVETLDPTSRVVFGPNAIDTRNTRGLINNGATGAGLVEVTATRGNIIIEGHKGLASGHTVYRWDTPDAKDYTVALASPGESVPSYVARGQIITVQIRNTLRGAMGPVAFNGSYKTSGPFPSPASGKSRSLTCVYDGTHCVEIYRSGADVAN